MVAWSTALSSIHCNTIVFKKGESDFNQRAKLFFKQRQCSIFTTSKPLSSQVKWCSPLKFDRVKDRVKIVNSSSSMV
jgi:hypothetical protein